MLNSLRFLMWDNYLRQLSNLHLKSNPRRTPLNIVRTTIHLCQRIYSRHTYFTRVTCTTTWHHPMYVGYSDSTVGLSLAHHWLHWIRFHHWLHWVRFHWVIWLPELLVTSLSFDSTILPKLSHPATNIAPSYEFIIGSDINYWSHRSIHSINIVLN